MSKTPSQGEMTYLLECANQGDDTALARFIPLVYKELRRLADRYLRDERLDHTLQPTALVHEAYLRLVGEGTPRWESSGHFLAIAANSMRQILVNHAKGKNRLKRNQGQKPLTFHDNMTVIDAPDFDLVALDEALGELGEINSRKVQVVECRFIMGLTVEEIARVLGISPATVKRDWDFARTWLLRRMECDEQTDS